MDYAFPASPDVNDFCWLDAWSPHELLEKAPTEIGSRLVSCGVAQNFAEELAKGILKAQLLWIYRGPLYEPHSAFISVGCYIAPQFWWAIRNDDLKLLEAIGKGLSAAASAGFFLGAGSIVGPLVAIGVTVAELVYRVRRKGAVLEPRQVTVLTALRTADDGLTAEEVAAGVAAIQLSLADPSRHVKDVGEALDSLTRVRLSDGSVVQLVARTDDGKWSAAGV